MGSSGRSGRVAVLAACGVVAPFVYTAGALAAGLRHPGYSHLKHFISELGAMGSPGAGLMNFAGFLPYGLLLIAFALAVHRGMRTDTGGWLGPSMLGVYGIAYVALAFAPCNPGCRPDPPSLHHQFHAFLGEVIFLAVVAGPFALFPRMLKDPDWRPLAGATLVLPLSAWLVLNLRMVGVAGGVRQRLWLLLLFVWIEIVAIRLLRLSSGAIQRSGEAA